MNIIPQSFANVLLEIIKNHFSFSAGDYIKLMMGIDKAFNDAVLHSIVTIFEAIDEGYRNSSIRKKNYHVKCYASRSLVTVFGVITYKRTWYTDKLSGKAFCYLDRFLKLPKKDIYDPYVKSLIIDFATSLSAPKAAEVVSEVIGCKVKFKDLCNRINISRQLVRNILSKCPSVSVKPHKLPTPDVLYIMADEKYVPRQGNHSKKSEIKLAVCFDGYRYISNSRTELVNKHYVSSVSGSSDIYSELLDYIYSTYDVDKIKKVIFMGDGANWIKNGRNNFKFSTSTEVIFALDHFHFKQALLHISRDDAFGWFTLKYVLENRKDYFSRLVDILVNKFPYRRDSLVQKRDYILNNWNFIQNMISNPKYKCSMEGHISHILADLFSSRPKGYSLHTLTKLLNLRTLKKNGFDLRKIYLKIFDKKYKKVNFNVSDILDYDDLFRNKNHSNIPYINNGKIIPNFKAIQNLAHPAMSL